ncbi:MAG: HU family DNA-binding protein [Synergistetes bacterium]|uniref:Histone family protein DNA-binding protein n=1 Tax=Thermotoga petrophila TaxID=93929 RepID=A0A124FG32_9THEM|nr:MAG: Histone family protein DNA-binding protein [Thermotoga petrophila]MBC7332071.1 HU family DNA-binding protein [Synergistota bacterium]MDK2870920.1 DNA-binding protein HU-beta [bacterium]
MTKAELVREVAEKTGMTKKDTALLVNTLFETIMDALSKGEKVQIAGFGIFEVKERAERVGRNPRTGEEIKIPPRKVPVFRVGKELKTKVMGK